MCLVASMPLYRDYRNDRPCQKERINPVSWRNSQKTSKCRILAIRDFFEGNLRKGWRKVKCLWHPILLASFPQKSAFRFSSRPDHGISRRVPVVPIIPIDKLSEHTKSPIGESRVSVLGLPFDSAVRSCQDAPQPTRYVPPLPSSRQPQ